jgi:hypothetical protein
MVRTLEIRRAGRDGPLLLLVLQLGIERAQRGHHGRGHQHGVRGLGIVAEEVHHALVQHGVAVEQLREARQLRLVGQLAVEEQVGHFHERAGLGQRVDVIPAVAQDPLLAIEEGDAALTGAGVAEAGIVGDQAGVGPQLADIDRAFLFGSLVDRIHELLARVAQLDRINLLFFQHGQAF